MRSKLIPLLVVFLSSCSQSGSGAGVSTGGTDRTEVGVGQQIKKDRTQSTSRSAEASVQFPATGLIVDVLFAPGDLVRQGVEFRINREAHALFRTGEPKDAALDQARAPIAAIMAPFRGWEVDPFDDSAQGRRRIVAYLRTLEASAAYTNAILTELAGKLSVSVQRDPDAARAEIRRLWASLDHRVLDGLWKRSLEASGGNIVLDLASGQGVGWSSSGGSFLGDTRGIVWERYGQTWLGDGRLSGKQYQIALASAIGAEMRATASATTQVGTGSRNETSGKASAGK